MASHGIVWLLIASHRISSPLIPLQVELRVGVLPSDWLVASNGAANRSGGTPPVLFRLGFRCSVLAFWLEPSMAVHGLPLTVHGLP